MSTNASPAPSGIWRRSSLNASTPPAEAPTPTIGKVVEVIGRGGLVDCAVVSGACAAKGFGFPHLAASSARTSPRGNRKRLRERIKCGVDSPTPLSHLHLLCLGKALGGMREM